MKRSTVRMLLLALCALAFMLLSPRGKVNGQQNGTSGWGIQFGSSAEDTAAGFALDSAGNTFCVGDTIGSMKGAIGLGDVFVSKHAPDGSLLWAKQFGTASGDTGTSAAVDASSNLYVVGGTSGLLFGTSPATDTDSFVCKYDANGNLIWGRQFRVSGTAQATAVAVGIDGSVYVTGATDGSYSGTNAGPSDPSVAPGSDDIYIMKLSSDGATQWTKQFGSSGDDDPGAMMLDAGGNIIIAGTTYHWLRAGHGGRDTFLAKLTPDGNILWNSEFGGTLDNALTSLYVNSIGNIYLATTEGGSQTPEGQPVSGQCKLYSFSNAGSQLWVEAFTTQLVTDMTKITSITGSGGNLYIGGDTTGNLFGPSAGFRNIFVARLASDGSIATAYQFGSDNFDSLCSLVAGSTGYLYLAGNTGGSLFGTNLGGNDVFLQKTPLSVQSARLSKDAMRKGLVCTKWNGQPIPLQHHSFHHGLTVYLYAGYLSRAVRGASLALRSGNAVEIRGQKMSVTFSLHSKIFQVGSRKHKMSTAPIVKDGNVYLPVDAFQQLYAFPITYDVATATVDFWANRFGRSAPGAAKVRT